ncbi:MAG: tRNA 4-thiouridine(8) synthase ThiI [Firmicutes bacterium]|nr:tRNA 4-thiouridine(8) synthase ThiI [Bacillota bacterium]
MEKVILIKYGELTTKKGNRNLFINVLTKNIEQILKPYDIKITKNRVRMFIEVLDGKFDEVVEALRKIFGLHGIVICHKVNTNDIEEMKQIAFDLLKEESFQTFKVVTDRADKRYPIKSMEVSRQIGGYLLKYLENKSVDVHNPELVLNIEIRDGGTYFYTREIEGIGGYPVGIQGKGLLMLSGGIDSPVAGYLALKRGIQVECIYFDSPPHTSVEAKNKVLTLASLLNAYSGNIKVHIIPFTKLQEAIYKNCDPNYMITIMRRMMYRISEKVAKRKNCKVIINGESIGQVASQTLTSISVINAVTNMPVIRPVACMDKLEIIRLSEKIGTYETSILPFEDCCTIFLPKHPVIHPVMEKVIEMENTFDYQTLITDCIHNMKTITTFETDEFEDLL